MCSCVRLADLYEDEDEEHPESKMSLADMLKVVKVLRKAAENYDRRGCDLAIPLGARANYVEWLSQGRPVGVIVNGRVMEG
jgi:hypothetical protein